MTQHNSPQTPAERRREKVREMIIDAAERVFAKEGEAGLSIRRLAEEIDYSPAAIYKYFDSKEALVDELKETFFARLHQRILETVERFSDERHDVCLRECIITYVETAVAKSHHYAAAFSTVGDPHEYAESADDWDGFIKTRKGIAFSFLVDSVKRGQDLDLFDTELDPALSAKSVWASCHGMAHLLVHMPRMQIFLPEGVEDEHGNVLRHHADIVVRGLMRPHEATTNHSLEIGQGK